MVNLQKSQRPLPPVPLTFSHRREANGKDQMSHSISPDNALSWLVFIPLPIHSLPHGPDLPHFQLALHPGFPVVLGFDNRRRGQEQRDWGLSSLPSSSLGCSSDGGFLPPCQPRQATLPQALSLTQPPRPRIVTGLDLKACEALLAWVPCSVTVKAAADPPCTRALWARDESGWRMDLGTRKWQDLFCLKDTFM